MKMAALSVRMKRSRKMLPYNQEYVLKEGTYPEKAQEIAAGRAFFDAVGYHDVKVGDIGNIGVPFRHAVGIRSRWNLLSAGFYMTGMNIPSRLPMLLFGSQDFYNERVAEGDRQYNIYFTLSDSANVSMNNVAPVIKANRGFLRH